MPRARRASDSSVDFRSASSCRSTGTNARSFPRRAVTTRSWQRDRHRREMRCTARVAPSVGRARLRHRARLPRASGHAGRCATRRLPVFVRASHVRTPSRPRPAPPSSITPRCSGSTRAPQPGESSPSRLSRANELRVAHSAAATDESAGSAPPGCARAWSRQGTTMSSGEQGCRAAQQFRGPWSLSERPERFEAFAAHHRPGRRAIRPAHTPCFDRRADGEAVRYEARWLIRHRRPEPTGTNGCGRRDVDPRSDAFAAASASGECRSR